eukprot:1159883-Pelagomonas_calceolata.AAC.8
MGAQGCCRWSLLSGAHGAMEVLQRTDLVHFISSISFSVTKTAQPILLSFGIICSFLAKMGALEVGLTEHLHCGWLIT